MQKFIKLKKKKKQEKAYCEVNTLFIGVIIINVYVFIYHWKGQPFIYQEAETIFFLNNFYST